MLYERVAGIDVHKDMIKVAIRSPGEKPWTRKTEVLEFRTFYGVLQEMARELRRRGVTHVVMEAAGVYTEPVYYAVCEQDFEQVAVINPAHAKALKGHKTDAKDCARLAELFECGLLRGSYIPPAELKEVRDLTRYRMKTVQARTSEIQRLGKALEMAGIKLGSVASSITGKASTAMIEALIDGERRGAVLADLAIGRCGPRGSWPICRWRWRAGSPSTTRCCAACTWTGSPCSMTRSAAWTSGSRARPRGGSARRACSRPCRASAMWWRRPGWARSAPPRTCTSPPARSWPPG